MVRKGTYITLENIRKMEFDRAIAMGQKSATLEFLLNSHRESGRQKFLVNRLSGRQEFLVNRQSDRQDFLVNRESGRQEFLVNRQSGRQEFLVNRHLVDGST